MSNIHSCGFNLGIVNRAWGYKKLIVI